MADIVRLPTKEERAPHLAGKARCLHCKHEWEAVSPIGVYSELECPSCHLFRGIFKATCGAAQGEQRWVCNCGCDVFVLFQPVFRCINCGTSQSF